MKKLSLSSILAMLGLCIIPACVLTVADDVADDDVGTDDATTTATDDATDDATTTATDDATTDATTTDDDVGTETTAVDTTDTTDTTTDTTDTGPVNMCGWSEADMYYDCGFEGADPGGTNPIECPADLVEGDPCDASGLTGEGCCDANGDNWYCSDTNVVTFFSCG